MKRIWLVVLLLLPGTLRAQGSNNAAGNLTAASASCLATNCVSLRYQPNTIYATITLSGTWSATVQFEVSGDYGVTWVAAPGTTSSTSNGTTQFTVGGYTMMRARVSAFVSGTVSVTIIGSTQSVSTTTITNNITGSGGGLPIGAIDASSPTYGYKTADGIHGAQASFTGTTANGTKNITTSAGDYPFCNGTTVACATGQPTSVGMLIEVNTGGVGQTNPSSVNIVAVDTIASVTSAHVAVTTTNTANATCSATCTIVWGPDNTAAMTAAWTAATGTAGVCNAFLLPASLTIVQSNFGSTSATCKFSGSGPTESETTVQGWGYFSSVIIPTTAFNFGTQCVGQGGSCFFGENGMNYREFGIWGASWNNTGSHTGIAVMADATDNHYERVSLTAWGANDGGCTGGAAFSGLHVMNPAGGTNLFDVTLDGVGCLPLLMDTGALHLTMYDCFVADSVGGASTWSGIEAWFHSGSVVSYGSVFEGANNAGTGLILVDAGVIYYGWGDGYNFSSGASNGPQVKGTAYLNGSQFFLTPGVGQSGLYVNGGTAYAQNTQFVGGSSTGNCVFIDASGKFINQGGNTWTTCNTKVNVSAGTASATTAEAGTVTCATSAATITFKGTYIVAPIVVIQDRTTSGVVTQTSINTTTEVVGCPGASDVLLYHISPNPA